MENKPCPICKQEHAFVKVEDIYFAMLNLDHDFFKENNINRARIKLKDFSPPQPPDRPFWVRTNPDMIGVLILAVFLLVPLVFLDGFTTNHAISFAIAFVFYIILRNTAQKWHQNLLDAYEMEVKAYKESMRTWRSRGFCIHNHEQF